MQIAMRDIMTAKRRAAPGPTPWEPFWISPWGQHIPIFHRSGEGVPPTLEFSYDKISWSPIDLIDEGTVDIPASGRFSPVYFRSGPGGNQGLCDIYGNNFTFFSDFAEGWDPDEVMVGGNILSLLSQSELTELPPDVPDGCFSGLFSISDNFRYTDASQLVLPRTTVPYMYDSLFYGAASLVHAPFLPAEQLAEGCYNMMFSDCVSLSEIRTAQQSFDNCQDWLYNVSDSGTFYCPAALGTDATIERGTSACPEGWTVVNF